MAVWNEIGFLEVRKTICLFEKVSKNKFKLFSKIGLMYTSSILLFKTESIFRSLSSSFFKLFLRAQWPWQLLLATFLWTQIVFDISSWLILNFAKTKKAPKLGSKSIEERSMIKNFFRSSIFCFANLGI